MIGLPMAAERIYTIDEVAEYLGFHRETISRWIRTGELTASKLGKKEYRIRQSDLDDLMQRKQIKPKKEEDHQP